MVTLPTDTAMTRRILATWRTATPEQQVEGASWYPRAWDICQTLGTEFGVPAHTVAALVAALSPLTHWERNLDYARLALTTGPHTVPTLGHARACAQRVLDGGTVTGRKVSAFLAAITGDPHAVVVDRHALAVVAGHRIGHHTPTPAQYRRVAAAYTRASHRAGVTPRDMQATTWVVQRQRSTSARPSTSRQP